MIIRRVIEEFSDSRNIKRFLGYKRYEDNKITVYSYIQKCNIKNIEKK